MSQRRSSPFLFLILVLFVKALVVLLVVQFGEIALSPDEAQYWAWSKVPSFGYYSKPPGIAWQIAMTTALFGDTELGVRFGALILSTATACSLYLLALRCNLSSMAAFFAATAFALSPLGFLDAFATTTDGGFLLFFVLASASLTPRPNWLLFGLWVALGALFKWTIFILFPIALFGLLLLPKMRSKQALMGFLIPLTALLPSLYWNVAHDFATFRHVATQTLETASRGNPLDFLASQIALFSPLYFMLWLFSARALSTTGHLLQFSPKAKIAALGSLSFFILYFALSFCKKIQANWAIYLYPLACIPLAAYALPAKKALFTCATVLACLLSLVTLALPSLQRHTLCPIPYKLNPLQQCLGWRELPKALSQLGYDPNMHILIGDKYQITSVLRFYVSQKAYFLNLGKARNNQFTYWPGLQKGQSGYFIAVCNRFQSGPLEIQAYLQRLAPYFTKVGHRALVPLFLASGHPAKSALIFYCEDYTGVFSQPSACY